MKPGIANGRATVRRLDEARVAAGIDPEYQLASIEDTGKSMVIRLVNAVGDAMFVKCGPWSSVHREWTAYRLLARVSPVPLVPRCIGAVNVRGSGWLFVEEAGGRQLESASPTLASHAAKWLARLHAVSGQEDRANWGLPTMGVGRHRDRASRLKAALELRRARVERDASEKIGAMVRLLDRLLDAWPAIATVCTGVPTFAVHGDLGAENMRVDACGGTLVVFDWEDAHLGVPAIDLARVSLPEYIRHAEDLWPPSKVDSIPDVHAVGRLFRTLRHRIERKPIEKIETYTARLHDDLGRLELL